MEKPTVSFVQMNEKPKKGFHAVLFPINHPNPNGLVSGRTMVVTSPIVEVFSSEHPYHFETENTIYKEFIII